LNFDIVSNFDIRISDFNPILAGANPFELHRLASPLTLAWVMNVGILFCDHNVVFSYRRDSYLSRSMPASP
jgi:hypothetical protein